MGTSWIIEGTVDDRWPINTRGNVGEVFPEVLTPLSYRLGVIAAERASVSYTHLTLPTNREV